MKISNPSISKSARHRHVHPRENACLVQLDFRRGENTGYSFAMGLRRTLLGEMPYVSFTDASDETRIARNTSMFNDEMVRKRIAMMPLPLAPGKVRRVGVGKYELVDGASAFEIDSRYDSEGADDGVYDVMSGELRLAPGASELGGSGAVGEDTVTGDQSILLRLKRDEEFRATAQVAVGSGLQHACFSPVGTTSYDLSGGSGDNERIHMLVEANNAGPPAATQHVYDAIYWAAVFLRDFRRKLSSAKYELLTNMKPTGVSITVPDETETRAIVVTAELRRLFMSGKAKSLSFAGHKVPHPLEANVVFHIQPMGRRIQEAKLTAWARAKMQEAVDAAIKQYESLRDKWPGTRPTIVDSVHSPGSEGARDDDAPAVAQEVPTSAKVKRAFVGLNDEERGRLRSTNVAEFSVTLQQNKDALRQIFELIPDRESVFEGFACIGSDTSLLLSMFKNVTSVELDPTNFDVLRHNMRIVLKSGDDRDRLSLLNEDVLEAVSKTESNAVYFDPPWGGVNYDRRRPTIAIGGVPLGELVARVPPETKHVVLKLPRNYDLDKIAPATGPFDLRVAKTEQAMVFVLLERKPTSSTPE